MEISIIILNYNTFELTCKCIESVIKHTQGIKYELILVDNASTECSPDLFLQRFPGIKLIRNDKNFGFAGGNNLGIMNSSGENILLLNSDVELTGNSVKSCLDSLKANREIGVVSCMLKSPEGSIQKQCQRFPSISRTLTELCRIHKMMPEKKRGQYMGGGFFNHTEDIFCDSVWGTFFMFPRKILGIFKDGKLPDDFFMYAEDLQWCYLIRKAGFLVYYNAATSVIHYSQASSANPVLKLKHKNEYSFMVKYHGWFYTKMYCLLRSMLFLSNAVHEYAREISRIYFNLFFTGEVN